MAGSGAQTTKARTTARPLLLASLIASLTGCSTVSVLNAIEPRASIAVIHDIALTTGDRGHLDVYRPASAKGAAPVVVFIYGGGWDQGDKGDYAFVGRALASKGYVAVIPDYRVYPQVRWPSFLEDNAKAVRWAKDNAAGYGGDSSRLFVMGHSAGAYNAAMLALDRRWLETVGMEPHRDLRGMIGLAGPYDFLPLHSEELKDIFGPAGGRPATQPINYVDGAAPPLFLAADTGDKVVDPGNTTRLATRVRQHGGDVQERYYRGLNHALMAGVIAAPLRFLAPVLRDSAAFIDARSNAAPEASS